MSSSSIFSSTVGSQIYQIAFESLKSILEDKSSQNNIVLLLDNQTEELLQSISPESYIIAAPQIACFRNLHAKFKTKIDLPGLFIVNPSQENIQKIHHLMSNNFFNSAEIHFTFPHDEQSVSSILNLPNVKILQSLSIPYVPHWREVLLFHDKEIIKNLRYSSNQLPSCFLSLINKIITTLIKFCAKTQLHFVLNDQQCVNFASILRDRLEDANLLTSDNSKDKILVTSRLVDSYPPFYQSDLFLSASFEFCIDKTMKIPGTKMEINRKNNLFYDNAHETMAITQENLKKQLDQYDKENNPANHSKDGIEERLIKLNQNNIHTEYLKIISYLIKHIAPKLNVNLQYLMTQYKIIAGDYDNDDQDIFRVASSPFLSLDEKMRLLVILCCRHEGKIPQDKIMTFTRSCSIPPQDVENIKKLNKIGFPISSAPLIKLEKPKAPPFDSEQVYIPKISTFAKSIISKGKHPDLGSLSANSKQTNNNRAAKGKLLNINAKQVRDNKPTLFVICLGGLTPFEVASIHRSKTDNYNFVFMTDRIIYPKNFISEISKEL